MREKVKQKLDELGVARIKFYRHRSPVCHNIFTACLLLDDQNVLLSRGIAICSVLDPFSKITGRGISFGRAFTALKNKLNSELINHLSRWKDKFVKRSLQVKRKEDENFFYDKVVPELKQLNDRIGITPTEVNIRLGEIREDGSIRKTIAYKIPRDYPVQETSRMFKYKSEYRPDLTETEKEFLSS